MGEYWKFLTLDGCRSNADSVLRMKYQKTVLNEYSYSRMVAAGEPMKGWKSGRLTARTRMNSSLLINYGVLTWKLTMIL